MTGEQTAHPLAPQAGYVDLNPLPPADCPLDRRPGKIQRPDLLPIINDCLCRLLDDRNAE